MARGSTPASEKGLDLEQSISGALVFLGPQEPGATAPGYTPSPRWGLSLGRLKSETNRFKEESLDRLSTAVRRLREARAADEAFDAYLWQQRHQ